MNTHESSRLLDIARGSGRNESVVEVIGINPDVDTGAEDLTDHGGTYTFSSDAGVALKISSSSAADGHVIKITGLSASWARQEVEVTLAGQTETAVTGTWARVNKIENTSATNPAGDVYVYEDDTVTAGVPDTASKVRAKIIAGNGVSMLGVHSIPAGHEGFIVQWGGSLQQSFDGRLEIWIREFGKAFMLYHRVYLPAESLVPEIPKRIPAKSDVKLRFTATADNTAAVGSMILLERKS